MLPTIAVADIHRLTIEQRLDLIGKLWDSIPNDPDALPIPNWHREIIDQRLAEADAQPDAGIQWEQFRSELRNST
jgi:putative addiction module component (TIGR02574 family)